MVANKPTVDWLKGTFSWNVPPHSDSLTLLAVGDMLFEESFLGIVADAIKRNGGHFLFAPTRSIFSSADVILGNLENPLCAGGEPIFKWGPNFRASPEIAKLLSEAGFDILGVANNHIRDYGDLGFLETLEHLSNAGVFSVGGDRDSSSASEAVLIEIGELSIGILAFTYRQESVVGPNRPGAADLDSPKCYEAVRRLRSKVDTVIVFLHMDPEYSEYPAPHRIEMAHNFIDAGAEIVIGHHPHVPQGLEIYRGKLIAYSLGNFIFHTQKQRPLTSLGYLLKITLTKKGVAKAVIIPYKIGYCCQIGCALCQPIPLANDEREGAIRYLGSISRGLKDPLKVKLNWENIASKEAVMIVKQILSGIVRGETSSSWLCHFASLKYRSTPFFMSLLNGNVQKFLKEQIKSPKQ